MLLQKDMNLWGCSLALYCASEISSIIGQREFRSMDIQSFGCTLQKETILENEPQIQSGPELQKINNLRMIILPFILDRGET
jgi:hypothetical protein